MTSLLDDLTEEHKVRNNQSIEDRWELSSQKGNRKLPCFNHQAIPDVYYQAMSSANILHGENFSFEYLLSSRSVTSRCILKERRKRMEKNLKLSSLSLPVGSAAEQRSILLHKQGSRPRQSLDPAIPFTGLQTTGDLDFSN
jgi:hypothetical protein